MTKASNGSTRAIFGQKNTPNLEGYHERALNIKWLGMRDSNPRMVGPEPTALPLGESPTQSYFSTLGTACLGKFPVKPVYSQSIIAHHKRFVNRGAQSGVAVGVNPNLWLQFCDI